jgi:hypothetical protein
MAGLLFGGNLRPWWDSQGFLYSPGWYRGPASLNFMQSNALESDTYTIFGFTYGYVQRSEFNQYAPKGGFADLRLNLLLGVNITLNIPLKKEGIFTPTDFNMSMRVRVFDDAGNLVATASSEGPDNACINLFCSQQATSSDTFDFFGVGRFTGSNRNPLANTPIDAVQDSAEVFGSLIRTGRSANPSFETYYVDPFAQSPSVDTGLASIDGGQVTADTFLWHGRWNVGPDGIGVTGWQAFDSDPDRNEISDFGTFQFNRNGWGLFKWKTWIPYGTDEVRVFIAGIYDPFGDPLDDFNAGTLHTKPWDSGVGQRISSMWYGIDGFSSTTSNAYSGSWTVEVDTWNDYPTPIFQTRPKLSPPASNWYPPVEGLLQGESYHVIRGHAAGPFGLVGSSLAANGLGPYGQSVTWTVPNARLGSETSVIFELDRRGRANGNLYGFVYEGELRTLSWVTLEAASTSETLNFTQWSWDSWFDMYLPPGDYTLSIIAWTRNGNQGYTTITTSIHVSAGQTTTNLTYQMQESKILIPEFNIPLLVLLSALAAAKSLARRKRRS